MTTTPVRIAIVADDATIHGLLVDLVSDEGYHATTHRVREAVPATIVDDAPTLILFDVDVLQPAAAWAVMLLLRLDVRTRTIPMVALVSTALDDAPQLARLTQLRVMVQSKPFSIEDLHTTIAKVIIALP